MSNVVFLFKCSLDTYILNGLLLLPIDYVRHL